MPRHIAFLRAVNVGKRQVKIAELRGWLAEAGFTEVQTHIQTGNVAVTSTIRGAAEVEREIETLLAQRCGFEVPCMVFSPAELRQISAVAAAIPAPEFADHPEAKRYVTLFKRPLSELEHARVAEFTAERERAWADGRAVHIWIAGGTVDAVVFKDLGKLLEPGTNRNLRVIDALNLKWC
ncbi:MAG: DUF1697 domain-containing protein [Nocardioidaceae bacterium]|nr:MAG: DUF1697 domain-containing protein [Nocardioidaceae bacterium]